MRELQAVTGSFQIAKTLGRRLVANTRYRLSSDDEKTPGPSVVIAAEKHRRDATELEWSCNGRTTNMPDSEDILIVSVRHCTGKGSAACG